MTAPTILVIGLGDAVDINAGIMRWLAVSGHQRKALITVIICRREMEALFHANQWLPDLDDPPLESRLFGHSSYSDEPRTQIKD